MTRETVDRYGCDYRATFGAAIKIIRAQMTDKLTKYARKGYTAEYDASGQIVLTPCEAFDSMQTIKVRGKGALIAKRQKQTNWLQSTASSYIKLRNQ